MRLLTIQKKHIGLKSSTEEQGFIIKMSHWNKRLFGCQMRSRLMHSPLYKNKQRSRSTRPLTGQSMDVGDGSGGPSKVHVTLSPWEMPAECVLEGLDFWQKGHYGPICKGTLRRKEGSTQSVVVKSLRDGPEKPEAGEFVELLQFHSRVSRHQNVVKMLFCQTSRLPMYLILEKSVPGNLLHFLWSLRNNNVTLTDQDFTERSVFVVAKQVAAGLDYLMSEHRLVHGDVAARNILLGPGLTARVGGLGGAFRARKAESAITVQTTQVPIKWQSPERIMMQLKIDRSDVWSFGILLYEMITLGSPPYPELEPLSVLPKLQRSYRMKRPNNSGASLYDLMKYCWMWSFKDRPTFSAIIKLLDSSLYLASTRPICVPDTVDRSHYNTVAGLTP
uniref:Protein kinase domain-containing protein n=1 Tax=Knipowitschia caucasica TaxID=637954 RepID=A0AAV2LZC0_KNICA